MKKVFLVEKEPYELWLEDLDNTIIIHHPFGDIVYQNADTGCTNPFGDFFEVCIDFASSIELGKVCFDNAKFTCPDKEYLQIMIDELLIYMENNDLESNAIFNEFKNVLENKCKFANI